MLRDIKVSAVGMGCMAFSHGYGKIPPEKYSIEAIQRAYHHGCTFFDTAEIYSPNLSGIGHNERIVGKALKDVRNHVVIATKLFLRVRPFGNVYQTIRGHLESSMERLKTDMVGLLKEYAAQKQATPAQISLAWMLHKYPNVAPIPGSKNKERIIENLDAIKVELMDEELAALEKSLDQCRVYGHRGLGGF